MAEQKKTGATVMQTVKVLAIHLSCHSFRPSSATLGVSRSNCYVLICIKNPLKSNGLS